MLYLGFDCHKDLHAWTLLDENGRIIQRGEVPNQAAAVEHLRQHLSLDEVAVGFEGPRDLRREVERAFADVPCFEICPSWTHARRKGSPVPDKDDPLDADRTAQMLFQYHERLVPLSLADEQFAELRAVVSIHRSTVRRLHAAQRRAHTQLTRLWQASYGQLFCDPLSVTAQQFFAAYPHPWHAKKARGLADRLRKWSRGHLGEPTARRIKEATRTASPPTAADELWIDELQESLREINRLCAKRDTLQQQMSQLLEAMNAGWLLQIPGVGVQRAATLVAAGLLLSPGPSAFARHAGIAPESESSGKRTRHRNARQRHEPLFQTMMGWAASLLAPHMHAPEARAYFDRKRQQGKTRRTALRCLARRQIDRLFTLRDAQRQLDSPPPPPPDECDPAPADEEEGRPGQSTVGAPDPEPHGSGDATIHLADHMVKPPLTLTRHPGRETRGAPD
jgi:hypothetical protein